MTIHCDEPLPLVHGVCRDRFRVPPGECSFKRQYAQLYVSRLSAARPHLVRASFEAWGAIKESEDIQNISPVKSPSKALKRMRPAIHNLAFLNLGETCVIIGILYKEMRLKPSILKELATSDRNKGNNVAPAWPQCRPCPRLIMPDDQIYLEDEAQRIALIFPQRMEETNHKEQWHQMITNPSNLVTGVVAALLGHESEENQGNFLVEDIVFLEPQPVIPITPRRISGVNWLALVSGLGFISYSGSAIPESYDRHLMSLTLLADWLREGEWARLSSSDVSTSISNCCLMILGDSIRAGHDGSCETLANCVQAKQARHLTFKLEAEGVAAMASFDAWLASLPLGGFNQNLLAKNLHEDVLACIGYTEKVNEVGHMESGSGGGLCVHLLPGPHDAVSCLMPQQPIHAATLPKSVDRVGSGKSGLRGVTNPHLCRVAGRRVLATSGQNSQQLAMYTDLADDLDRMEASLHWGHLAPTCPDSLLGYPLSDCDPLLMRFPPADSSIAFNSIDYPDIYVSATGQSEVKQPVWRRANLFPHLTATKQGRGTSEVVTAEGALLVSVPRFDMSHCIALVDLDSLDCHIVHFDVDSTC